MMTFLEANPEGIVDGLIKLIAAAVALYFLLKVARYFHKLANHDD